MAKFQWEATTRMGEKKRGTMEAETADAVEKRLTGDGLTITRDARFPVRVTLQFYQATSNGVVSRDDVKAMAAQIKKVYGKGDYVGSLVVPSGLDRKRPTNWDGVHKAFDVAWTDFPGLVERFTMLGVTRPLRLGVK